MYLNTGITTQSPHPYFTFVSLTKLWEKKVKTKFYYHQQKQEEMKNN